MSNVTPNVNLYWGCYDVAICHTGPICVGKQFYLEAYAGILRHNYGMSFLISLGTSAVFLFGLCRSI